jgi:hypothetical protein
VQSRDCVSEGFGGDGKGDAWTVGEGRGCGSREFFFF